MASGFHLGADCIAEQRDSLLVVFDIGHLDGLPSGEARVGEDLPGKRTRDHRDPGVGPDLLG